MRYLPQYYHHHIHSNMKGHRASHFWLLILLFVMALTFKVSHGDDKTNATSLTHHQANVDDKDADSNNVVMMNKGKHNGRGYWGGGSGGGGSYGGGGGGGGGWGWGGGGGGWWGWGCRRQKKYNGNVHKNEGKEYIMGEFAQCMGNGRCKWRRLDCPLHCGGDCFYDCKHMCKAHCRR